MREKDNACNKVGIFLSVLATLMLTLGTLAPSFSPSSGFFEFCTAQSLLDVSTTDDKKQEKGAQKPCAFCFLRTGLMTSTSATTFSFLYIFLSHLRIVFFFAFETHTDSPAGAPNAPRAPPEMNA